MSDAGQPVSARDADAHEVERERGVVDPAPRRSGLDDHGRVKRTRAATLWASAMGIAMVTILLVVFVVQNPQPIDIEFLWLDGEIATAAAILLAAVAGALLMGLLAGLRIGQLRRSLKRNG